MKVQSGVRPWFTVQGLSKSYGGVRALSDVDFELLPNVVYGFIGPNGAGKSTLMKILTGAVAPDEGTVLVDGVAVETGSPAAALDRGLVMMPQEMTLVPDFSVADNIVLGAEPTRGILLSDGRARESATRALQMVHLDVDPTRAAGSLSPVQQRLLMLARAVSRETRLLILDEPTAGLAPAEAQLVTDTVLRLKDHGLTVAYVSHHLTEVATLCEEVLCVREGRLTARLRGADVTKDALVDLMIGGDATALEPVRGHAGTSYDSEGELRLEQVCGQRLRDVSIVARRGEVTGLTGLLGSGVDELVAILSGTLTPTSGRIALDGEEIKPRSPADALRHGIGIVTGDRARSALLTRSIRDNVSVTALRSWFGRLGIIRAAKERALVDEHLASLSVKGDPERPLTALSGGNQQRVLVSRLLAANLDVMIFDNPTVGVDISSRAELWSELRALAESRIVIVASGENDELIGVCDRVVCVHNGTVSRLLEKGEVTERTLTAATT